MSGEEHQQMAYSLVLNKTEVVAILFFHLFVKMDFKTVKSEKLYLRTFALIVPAHPYCARKFTCHVIHRARALNTKLNNNRADGHCHSFAWI